MRLNGHHSELQCNFHCNWCLTGSTPLLAWFACVLFYWIQWRDSSFRSNTKLNYECYKPRPLIDEEIKLIIRKTNSRIDSEKLFIYDFRGSEKVYADKSYRWKRDLLISKYILSLSKPWKFFDVMEIASTLYWFSRLLQKLFIRFMQTWCHMIGIYMLIKTCKAIFNLILKIKI